MYNTHAVLVVGGIVEMSSNEYIPQSSSNDKMGWTGLGLSPLSRHFDSLTVTHVILLLGHKRAETMSWPS